MKQKLTKEQRDALATSTISAMADVYEAEGEEGDFDDGRRYLRDDASDEELLEEHAKWTAAQARLENTN